MANNICDNIRCREEQFVADCIREYCGSAFNEDKWREAPLSHMIELDVYNRFSIYEYERAEGTGRVLDVMLDERPYKRLDIEVIFNEMS